MRNFTNRKHNFADDKHNGTKLTNGRVKSDAEEAFSECNNTEEYIRGEYILDACPPTPFLTRLMVAFCHFILVAIAIVAEWLRHKRYIKNDWERKEQNDFAPLGHHFNALFANNIYRKASDILNRPIASTAGPVVRLKGRVSDDHGWTYRYNGNDRDVINMGSYNYLGFSQKFGPCADATAREVDRSGISACATRQEFGIFSLQVELEKQVARFLGVEAAICFPMGFSTNSMSLPSLANEKTLVLSDELNHSSLILGHRISKATVVVFKHNDAADCEKKLCEFLFKDIDCDINTTTTKENSHESQTVIKKQKSNRIKYEKILIVVEGIYSMEGTILDLAKFIEVKKRYKAYLFIDEAHSIGALGETGRGIVEYWKCNAKDVDILMGTMTKAGAGGYVAGSQDLINHLKLNTAGSIYGSVMPPPLMAQVITSMKIMSGEDNTNVGQERNYRLARNTVYFRRRLRELGFVVYGHDNSPVIPVLVYSVTKLMCYGRETLRRGLAIVSVGYPAVPLAKARVRFCVSADHTDEQLEKALQIADEVGNVTRTKHLFYSI